HKIQPVIEQGDVRHGKDAVTLLGRHGLLELGGEELVLAIPIPGTKESGTVWGAERDTSAMSCSSSQRYSSTFGLTRPKGLIVRFIPSRLRGGPSGRRSWSGPHLPRLGRHLPRSYTPPGLPRRSRHAMP